MLETGSVVIICTSNSMYWLKHKLNKLYQLLLHLIYLGCALYYRYKLRVCFILSFTMTYLNNLKENLALLCFIFYSDRGE